MKRELKMSKKFKISWNDYRDYEKENLLRLLIVVMLGAVITVLIKTYFIFNNGKSFKRKREK